MEPLDLTTLRGRYTAEPVPPCRVCGRELTVQSSGGGNATTYGCSGLIPDPADPENSLIRDPNRTIADKHYSDSKWTQYRSGDTEVIALIDAFEALVAGVREKASALAQSTNWEGRPVLAERGMGEEFLAMLPPSADDTD